MATQKIQGSANGPEVRANQFIKQLKACHLFAEALTLCLESTGVRQIELSQRLHVEAATVHNWRTNKRLPDAPMVLRVASALALTSTQQRMLIDVWRVTRRARELIPCVEEATQANDTVTVLALKEEFSAQLADAQRQFQSRKWDNHYANREQEPRHSELDPEIWLYSGY